MMPVVAWTPDNQTDIVQLIQMGIDGIITNVPGNALTYVSNFYTTGDSDDKFSISDVIWVALGSAGTHLSLSLSLSL